MHYPSARTADDLEAQARSHLTPALECSFIEGRQEPLHSRPRLDLVHPGNGLRTGSIPVAAQDDIDTAVRSARAAFDSGTWSRRSPRQRGKVLLAFADLIDQHRDELALLETLDMGKPIRDAYRLDVPKAAHLVRWYAELADKQYGDVAPTDGDVIAYVRRVPLGVVACITPWNFPLYQAAYKLGPVLATGNSLIIKPSELAPRSTLRVAQLAVEAGIPPGVLNVVTGDGPTTGAALAAHPGIDAIAFTGSAATAAQVTQAAAVSLARVSVEAGGKSAHVVLDDVDDLDHVARAVTDGFCFNQGQVCSAGSRLIVPDDLADDLIKRVAEACTTYTPGPPFHPGTTLGPVVSESHLQAILAKVDHAVRQGARVLLGGTRADVTPGGSWMRPTIIDGVSPQAAIAQEEVFGPVLTVLRYRDPADAIAMANGTPYALGAAVWSTSIDRALQTSQRLHAGQIWINTYDSADVTVPWGGFKRSGAGRDKSLEALHEYTGSTTTWVQLRSTAANPLTGKNQ